MNKAQVLPFPEKRSEPRSTKPAEPAGDFKYFTEQQIRLLRRSVRDEAQLARQKGQVTAVREWLLIDLLTCTGVREAEAAQLLCGDLKVGYGESAIHIRCGKGRRSRTVQIPEGLKTHLKGFLRWKTEHGEGTGEEDAVFLGQRGPWTPAAVQQVVKKWLRKLGIYEKGKSAHALRHSYAVALYRRERDLRAVQKQLGHASIQTTQIYADVLSEDIQKQISGLWN